MNRLKICVEDFYKKDLKTGMLVQLKNNILLIVIKDSLFGDILLSENHDYIKLEGFYQSNKFMINQDYDMIRIYKPKNIKNIMTFNVDNYELIWESKTFTDNIK